MFKVSLLLCLSVVLLSPECDPEKQDQRIASLESEVKQLKAEVAGLKQKPKIEHHYELRNSGLRTWRFDSASGETCIQLTSPADWKRKDTKSQSCECTDAMQHWSEMPVANETQINTARSYYNSIVTSVCY